jgi:hypothetical protein
MPQNLFTIHAPKRAWTFLNLLKNLGITAPPITTSLLFDGSRYIPTLPWFLRHDFCYLGFKARFFLWCQSVTLCNKRNNIDFIVQFLHHKYIYRLQPKRDKHVGQLQPKRENLYTVTIDISQNRLNQLEYIYIQTLT